MNKRYIILVIIFLATIVSFLNALLVKVFDIGFIPVSINTENFWYDISISIFTGGLVFFAATFLPDLFLKNSRKKIVVEDLISLNKYVITTRFKRLKLPVDCEKNECKKIINGLKYDQVIENEIVYNTLREIHERVCEFHDKTFPVILVMNDIDLMEKLNELRYNGLFSRNLKYLNQNLTDLQNTQLEIGTAFFNFTENLKDFKNELNKK